MSLLLLFQGGGSGGTTITGTLAATDSADSAAFAGDVCHVGTLAATDGADTAAFAGDHGQDGTLAATDSADSAAFSGDVCHVGTLAATDGADTFAASGDVIAAPKVVTGDLAATDSADSFAAFGNIDHVGALAATDGADSFAADGEISHVGALDAADGADSAAFIGDVESQAPSKVGGDDAYHHPGWDKQAWQRKKKREDAISETIAATYRRILGIEPTPEVVAQVKKEIRQAPIREVIQPYGWEKEREFLAWTQQQIALIKQQEIDDEEALLLIL